MVIVGLAQAVTYAASVFYSLDHDEKRGMRTGIHEAVLAAYFLEREGAEGIYYEELLGNEGFRGASVLMYRLQRPTQVLRAETVLNTCDSRVRDRVLPVGGVLAPLGRRGGSCEDEHASRRRGVASQSRGGRAASCRGASKET